MFTWISKATCLSLILLLSGCQGIPGTFARPPARGSMPVLGGAITVAAPAGYCVDKQSAREQNDGAVVLIGRCNRRSQSPPAVISATMGTAGSAGVMASGSAVLTAFFQSQDGRAALSRTGNAQTVQILAASERDGALVLHIADDGAGPYWRAVFGLSGRLVTLSVQGANQSPIDPVVGQRLLGAALFAMRKANALK